MFSSKKPQQLDPIAESELRQTNMNNFTDLMRREMDHKNYKEGINYAYKICEQMNTSNLIPAQYYNLYLVLQQCLSVCDLYLRTDFILEGNDILDLYEIVQTFECALPRLYLMTIIGAAGVKSNKISILMFLKDIVEMSRSVQHPTKGIFLRCFIVDCVKNILPDSNCETPENGSLYTSIEFLMNNFAEMLRLLARLNDGNVENEVSKKNEQQQLCQIVGKNLMILSNLEGVSLDLYATNILPRFLEQVLLSRDRVAQDYLYDAVVQAFSTEYLLATLHALLHSLGGVVKNVGLRVILCNLMERVIKHVLANPEIERNIDMYQMFSTHITQILKNQDLSCEDYCLIFLSLSKLSLTWHSEDDAYLQLNSINDNLYDFITTSQHFDEKSALVLVEILKYPFEKYNFLKVLSLRVYPELINLLPYKLRHEVHRFIAAKMIEMKFIAKTGDEIALIIRCIETCYRDANDMTPLNDEELRIDCDHFKKVILSIEIEKETFYDIIKEIKNAVRLSMNRRTLMILPTVVNLYLKAVQKFTEDKVKIFKAIYALIKTLNTLSKMVTFKTLLESGAIAANLKYEQAPYFFEKALTLFEDEKEISNEYCLRLLIQSVSFASLENNKNEIFLTCCAKFISIIPTSYQRSKLYCLIAEGLFNDTRKISKSAVSFLQKAVKEAGSCEIVEQNMELMIDILNIYIIQFLKDNEDITAEFINNFANVVKDHLAQHEIERITNYYKQTVEYIKAKPEDKVNQLNL